jgi:hypothetical protein
MKKLLFVFVLLSASLYAQSKVGTTFTPYDTTGWNPPQDSTLHYKLPIYRLLSNPGGWINISQVKIDSLLNALIVYTDTKQLVIQNDTLVISDSASGQHAFTTTATSDSIAVVGLDSLDIVVVSPCGTVYNVNDLLYVHEHTGYFKVWRNAGGTSGLIYNWIWIRKH